jgi:hypothetical protein
MAEQGRVGKPPGCQTIFFRGTPGHVCNAGRHIGCKCRHARVGASAVQHIVRGQERAGGVNWKDGGHIWACTNCNVIQKHSANLPNPAPIHLEREVPRTKKSGARSSALEALFHPVITQLDEVASNH